MMVGENEPGITNKIIGYKTETETQILSFNFFERLISLNESAGAGEKRKLDIEQRTDRRTSHSVETSFRTVEVKKY